MPPIRPLPLPKPPMKTERSHEENQERAYIAASRRSDRSLEARIESARRASEIHKRRTGRSLRVTEQDVVNEEMYEEEDDDLPLQYKRLTAHLSGSSSSDLSRRIAAYVTNQVAIRNALALTSGLDQKGMNIQQWGPSNFEAAQPWLQSQRSLQTHDSSLLNTAGPDGSASDLNLQQLSEISPLAMPSAGQSPFIPPHALQDQQLSHHRSSTFPSSDPAALDARASLSTTEEDRSKGRSGSVAVESPAVLSAAASPNLHPNHSKGRSASASVIPAVQPKGSRNNKTGNKKEGNEQQSSGRPNKRAKRTQIGEEPLFYNPFGGEDLDVLSTKLPPETQMFLPHMIPQMGPSSQDMFTMNQDDPLRYMFEYYGNKTTSDKPSESTPDQQGMNQTLAPPMMKAEPIDEAWDSKVAWPSNLNYDQLVSPFDTKASYGFDNSYGSVDAGLKPATFDPSSGIIAGGSGHATPLDNDWSHYFDSSVWDENTAT